VDSIHVDVASPGFAFAFGVQRSQASCDVERITVRMWEMKKGIHLSKPTGGSRDFMSSQYVGILDRAPEKMALDVYLSFTNRYL